MEIRPLTLSEQKYTYAQSTQISGQTGNIGHLRGDFAHSGYGFYTTWFDNRAQWKTDEFKSGLDAVINGLREDKMPLHNRYDMTDFCRQHKDSAFPGNYCTEYGFRVDTEKHAFLLRCNPSKGDYNFYCFCYVKEWLDRHIGKAEQGIRFIDPNYKELFRIPDGGKIVITTSWGEKMERTCRYIDEYHTEIGGNLYHICEFAERMAHNRATYERSRRMCRPGKEQNTKTMNDKEDRKMAVNPKAIKVLNKVLDAGFTDEKAIAAMTIDDILKMQGVTVADIGIINELQKSIKANKVISFLGGGGQ